jgi:hypothetical protein
VRLQILSNASWRVVAPVTEAADGPTCPLIESLGEFAKRGHEEAVAGLGEIWKRIDQFGPRALGASIYHQVDKDNSIYQFSKGRLRVLCFEAPHGRIVVCATVFLKQSQRTPSSEIASAIRIRRRFLSDFDAGRIEYIDL